MKRPVPRAIKPIPSQIIGLYCPVLRIAMPVKIEVMERAMAVGSRQRPDQTGDFPRTAICVSAVLLMPGFKTYPENKVGENRRKE
jgi:hypothetical protein